MLIIMLIACLLIFSGLTSRNTFSLGTGSKNFGSAKPGIVGLTKHTAILGLAMWWGGTYPYQWRRSELLHVRVADTRGFWWPQKP